MDPGSGSFQDLRLSVFSLPLAPPPSPTLARRRRRGHSLTCPRSPPGGEGSKDQGGEGKSENCMALQWTRRRNHWRLSASEVLT